MASKEEIELLAKTVRDEGEGRYSVASATLLGWRYLCEPRSATSPARCDCEDQRRKRDKNPAYRCKHLQAIRLFVESTRVKPPTINKMNDAMETFIKGQLAKQQSAPKTLGLYDQLKQVEQQINRGDRSQLTLGRYQKLRQRYSDEEEPRGLAFW